MLIAFIILIGYITINKLKLRPKSKYYFIYGIILGVIIKELSSDNILVISSNKLISITPSNLIFYFIPPLMYKASYDINFHIFKNTFIYNLLLSLIAIIVNIFSISLFLDSVDSKFSKKYSMLIASILSAIDPIAITSILPELTLSDKLLNLIESESLLNDEMAICSFYLLSEYYINNQNTNYLLIYLFRLISEGFLIGLGLLLIKITILKKLSGDFMSQVTISICFCYLSFYISDRTIFNASGILAVVTLGILMSAFGKTRITPEHIEKLDLIWSILTEYSNLCIFSVSGLIISNKIDFGLISKNEYLNLFYLYLFINLVRISCCLLFYPYLKRNILHYDFIDLMVIFFSGIRGEISLALSLVVYTKSKIPFEIRNKILFYVSGIVLISISLNSLVINYIIKYFHRDKIRLASKQLDIINTHINSESKKYLHQIQDTDFHLSKVNYEKVNNYIKDNLEKTDVVLDNEIVDKSIRKIFLNTLKKNIWILFEEHLLHHDIVMKLIQITDHNLDNLNSNWASYMNEYCQKEHIRTKYVCFISNIPIIKNITPTIISYLIEYNYNLIIGYTISLKKSLIVMEQIVQDDEEMIDKIRLDVEDALIVPYHYLEYLEQRYSDLLSYIETKQMILLIISKQKSHLNYLKKNGEISNKIHNKLMRSYSKKELSIKTSFR